MNTEIKIDLKNITGELLTLSKPGNTEETDAADVNSLENFKRFSEICAKNDEHTNVDMAGVAALLIEMQLKENVPEEYVEKAEIFSELVKKNKKLDISESRDYLYFAYECMRELEKLENKVLCTVNNKNLYALASQDDDISCIVVVNNSGEDVFTDIDIEGLPGRSTSIDYYFADEYNQLSIVCNTDTKLEKTKIMIPMSSYSLHLFKIR